MDVQNITLNGVRCVSIRFVASWKGPWIADIDIDPDGVVDASSVPSGKVTISIGDDITLAGTVDPNASGRWVAGVPLRVVAGGGGWDQPVPAQDFQTPSGVSALAVEQQTAGLVGETINDPQPASLGLHWVRTAGRASQIFSNPDRDWYVDVTGVTQVGTWPAATLDPSVELLNWDPLQQRGTLSADALVLPGMTIADSRFDGTVTIRDVEQVWDKSGTRVTVWCSEAAVGRLLSALTNGIRALAGTAALAWYSYRIVSQTGALLSLQAVANPDGTPSPAPDTTNVTVWPGMSGASAQYAVGSMCAVVFLSAQFGNPIVVAFDGSVLPDTATYDATGALNIGPTASSVAIAGGGPPLARVGDTVLVYFPPSLPFSGVVGGIPAVGVLTIPGPGIGSIQTGSGKANSG